MSAADRALRDMEQRSVVPVEGASMIARRNKRVLVTGGAGFLGSHLCERLVERG